MKTHELHNYPCPECKGNKRIFLRTASMVANGSITCPSCNGTGKHSAITELLDTLILLSLYSEKIITPNLHSTSACIASYDAIKKIESICNHEWDQIKKEIEL